MPEFQAQKLSHYFAPRKQRGEGGLPVLSVTMRNGLVPRHELDRKMDSNLAPEEHLLVEPGDIAYNMMRMWQGAVGLAAGRANVSPAYVVMRPKETVDPRFAFHWFKSDHGLYLLWAYSYGLTDDRLRLYPNEFLRIPVLWPDRAIQRRIAAVLDAWDDAISKSEDLAAARAKVALREVEEIVARLPETTLGELAQITMGQSPPSSSYCPPHSSGALPLAGGASDFDPSGRVDAVNWTTRSQKKVSRPAVIMSVRAPVGSFALNDDELSLGRGVCALTPVAFDGTQLLAFLVGRLETYWRRIKQGGTFESVNGDDIREAPVPDVRASDPELLDKLIECVNLELRGQRKAIQLLRRQKRGLMQKLLTGEWSVPESVDRLMPGGGADAALAEVVAA